MPKKLLNWLISLYCLTPTLLLTNSARADTKISTDINIPPVIIQNSPILQKWLQEVPNVLKDIYRDPSFQTHFNFGFVIFPSNQDITGIKIALQDLFLGRTGLTISADYQTSFNGDRVSTGADLHYFLLPLGNYINLAPLVGYRYLQSDEFNQDGVNLGLRLMLALSRTGAADITLAQSFVAPGSDQEVGLFSVAIGYSISSRIRLSTNWETQNSQYREDNAFSIGLQCLF